ncbi:MAG: hypothetical protein J5806_07980 [Lentisphaeria bacterium]|nr:hypothetical protein [Lentisphaeria bacterium]
MRSFFCSKCHLEFDLDEDFEEGDNTVFCPQCKVYLAQMLPETPDRIIMREKRRHQAQRKELLKIGRLLLGTLIAGAVDVLLIRYCGQFPWVMLTAGLIGGIPTGLWVRRLTADRSWRAGILAAVLVLLVLAAEAWILVLTGKLNPGPALRQLTAGIITAWCFAVFEMNS